MGNKEIQNVKAYQVLTYLTYKDYPVCKRDGDWIKLTSAEDFSKLLNMKSTELNTHLEYLKKGGYILDFEVGEQITSIKMLPDHTARRLKVARIQINQLIRETTEVPRVDLGVVSALQSMKPQGIVLHDHPLGYEDITDDDVEIAFARATETRGYAPYSLSETDILKLCNKYKSRQPF